MKEEYSAGGIVYKKEGNKTCVLISQHSGHHGWVFPKGHVGDKIKHETPEAAAVREVTEETGVTGALVQPLTPIGYWYSFQGEKRHKTVQYFLMTYVSGDTGDHDFEMERVEWLPVAEVEKHLTYVGDKKAWKEAQEIMKEDRQAPDALK